MLWRISFFLLWQLAGGGLGWWQGGPWGAALGAAIAAWAWFVWDLLRSVRVLRWLRTGDLASVPSMRGIWGEAADRARRLLRKQEAQIRDSQNRLQEILAALQASPNGVVLLDAQGRKLSKSDAALPVDPADPLPALRLCWSLLGQEPTAVRDAGSVAAMLQRTQECCVPAAMPARLNSSVAPWPTALVKSDEVCQRSAAL